MQLYAVWEGEPHLGSLRVVQREGWNGPLTDLVDVVSYVAEQLRGQCQEDLPGVLERLGIEELETQPFCHAIDEAVFCCNTCGWWCEQSEMSDKTDWVCDDCEPEGDDD